jgi:hypothetical protein
LGKVAISSTETQTEVDVYVNWKKHEPRCMESGLFWSPSNIPSVSNNGETQTFPWLPLATFASHFLLLYLQNNTIKIWNICSERWLYILQVNYLLLRRAAREEQDVDGGLPGILRLVSPLAGGSPGCAILRNTNNAPHKQ